MVKKRSSPILRKKRRPGWEGRKEYGEDCLNLNIYVPARAALEARREGKGLPVAVYIHGGAFQNGSNRDRSGKQIIRDHSFIYVSINYRLGVLGYLYLGAALGEEYRGTGNNGTLDQLAALRWIYDNIGEFGGDRSRITVFGESAGAKDPWRASAEAGAKNLLQPGIDGQRRLPVYP